MKKLAFTMFTAILFTIPSLCWATDSRGLQPGMAARIQALRQQVIAEGGTYEVAYSAAMDKQIEQLATLKAPPGWNRSDAPSFAMLESNVQATPSSYDWSSLQGVTPIKDQGSCGSCWAFSTVGPLESQILMQDGVTVDLSEQYLVSCNLDGWSCAGGWWAHDYHLDRSGQDNNGAGAVLEADKPYTGTNAACGGPYNHPYKIANWAYVGGESAIPSVQAIKQAIYTYGPISAAVYVGKKFQAYSGGIFNTDEASSHQINHAIVLVGWNDDLGPNNGYWILRNSWGTSWGESGYMRIRYGVNKVGYAANFIEYASGTSPGPISPPVVYKPDLTGVFTNLSTGSKGKTVTGTFRVENIGNIATAKSSFRLLLYVSEDGVAKTSLMGSSTISTSIKPGSYVSHTINRTFPTSVIGKYLIAVVDPDSSVPDSNSSNNVVVSNVIQAR